MPSLFWVDQCPKFDQQFLYVVLLCPSEGYGPRKCTSAKPILHLL